MRRLIPALTLLVLGLSAPAADAAWYGADPIDGPADIVALGDVDLARDGTGAIVYTKRIGGTAYAALSRFYGGSWHGSGLIGGPGGVSDITAAASDGTRLAVAWIEAGDVYGAVVDGTGPLGAATRLSAGGGAANLALDMGINGHAYAVWTQPGGGGSDVRAARLDDGTWAGVPAPLDIDPNRDAGSGAGRPRVAVSAEGNSVVLWGEAGHVFARRLTGVTLSQVPQDLAVAGFEGFPGGVADQPDVDIEYDGSFAWAVFRQVVGGRTRSLARRLRGSIWEPPVAVDGGGTSTEPRIAIAGNGAGTAVTQVNGGVVVGSPLVFDAMRPPVGLANGTSPAVAFSERGEPAVAWIDGNGQVRGRFAEDVQEQFGPEAVVSRPDLGAVAAGEFAISSDRAGDMAVGMVQGPAGSRWLTAAMHDIPPSRPSGATTQKWQHRNRVPLRWSSGLDLLGSQQFKVFVDGVEIATTGATKVRPAPIADGVHRWQVVAIDRRGQATAGRSRRLRVDTVPPTVTVRTRRSGRSVRVLARVRDTAGMSGFDRVSVDYGDGKSRGRELATTHRYRRGGRVRITVRGYELSLAGGRALELGRRPRLMGIVNATPDSFSDGGDHPTVESRLELGRALLAAGADLLDVGGESARGDRPAVDSEDELERVVPLIEGLTGMGAIVSVDTYKPAVAEAAIAAGASLVNDVSGLADPALADVCARTGAGLVLMHTRVEPKGTLLDPDFYDDVVADVVGFLGERMALAERHGVAREQLLLDPGPDFAKTPAQTVAVLRHLDAVRALGRPLLLAVSNKDFVGALTGRGPRERLAGTLAALAHGADAGAAILRVHDVAAAADFLAVRAALRGERRLAPEEGLTPDRFPGR
jgi:dihydropteroate synthase